MIKKEIINLPTLYEHYNFKSFIIYRHICKITGKVYIGQTYRKPEKRWGKDGSGYKQCKLFYRAIKKYGWDNFTHEILFYGLTLEQANQKEIELITYYKKINLSYNITNGGGGSLGRIPTNETRKKLSESRLGSKNPRYGKHLTKETKEKISKANKGRFPSDESRKKMSKSRTGSKHFRSRRVLQMDLLGNPIKEWDCVRGITRSLKINQGHISEVCRGERPTAGGYRWKYL